MSNSSLKLGLFRFMMASACLASVAVAACSAPTSDAHLDDETSLQDQTNIGPALAMQDFRALDSIVRFGEGLAVSSDGTRVAVGNTDLVSSFGVTIFDQRDGVWVGKKLAMPSTGAGYGLDLSISGNGKTLVALGKQYDAESPGGGSIALYREENGVWAEPFVLAMEVCSASGNQPAPARCTSAGDSASVSTDGLTVAIGSPTSERGRGAVRVYRFDGQAWSLGDTLSAPSNAEFFGQSVSLAGDGSSLAVGSAAARNNTGLAVYVFDRQAQGWRESFQHIHREPTFIGVEDRKVELSRDGSMLAFCGGKRTSLHLRSGVSFVKLSSLRREVGGANSFAFSSDGRTFAQVTDYNSVAIYQQQVRRGRISYSLRTEVELESSAGRISLDGSGQRLFAAEPFAANRSGRVTLFASP